MLKPPSSLPNAKMEATAASERNNLWTRFNVQIVGWVQYIIVSFSMIMAFSVVPLYIETLPLPWRIYAVVIWAFNQPVFHAIWLSFLPPRIPPSYPTFAAQIILLVSWLWSIASIRESLGLNGRHNHTQDTLFLTILVVRLCCCRCGCFGICRRGRSFVPRGSHDDWGGSVLDGMVDPPGCAQDYGASCEEPVGSLHCTGVSAGVHDGGGCSRVRGRLVRCRGL